MRKIFNVLVMSAFAFQSMLWGALEIRGIKINNLENPQGVDNNNLFVSWKIDSDKNATIQKSRQITLKDFTDTIIWQSQEIQDNKQIQIPIPAKLEDAKKYSITVSVKDNHGQNAQASAEFISGLDDWHDAKWIRGKDKMRSPFLGNILNISDDIESAYAYICGLGLHEFLLNDMKVSDKVLEPVQTQYDQYACYTTYDITNLVKKGSNDLKIWLGDGFYYQDKVWGEHHPYYNFAMAKCCIVINYKDGKKEFLISDENWKYSPSPLSWANIHEGEDYDANLEGVYNWQPVIIATGKDIPEELRPMSIESMKVIKEVEIKDIWKSENGYIIDLGQNIVGWAEVKFNAPKDKKITLRFTEEITPDKMNLDWTSTGIEHTEVEQRINFVSNGKKDQMFRHRFSYHGFRYIEVQGLDEMPKKDFLKGLVIHTAMKQVGNFACSHETINKMHEICIWSLYGNTFGLLAEDPIREKCGWAVANSIAEAIMYNFDAHAFFSKTARDMNDSFCYSSRQLKHKTWTEVRVELKPDNIPFNVSPGKRTCGMANFDFGIDTVLVPYFLYQYYGDENILKEAYPYMKSWHNYLISNLENNLLYGGLGDWCSTYMADCPIGLSDSIWYYNEVNTLLNIAQILGYKKEIPKFVAQSSGLANTINEKHYNAEKKYYPSKKDDYATHTGNAMALIFGVAPEADKQAISDAIVKSSKENFHSFMNAGNFGIYRVLKALADNGNAEYAFQLLDKKGEHSFDWQFSKLGVTTIWETIPVCSQDFNPHGNHNMIFQGAYDQFFYECIAGISVMKEFPGFKKTLFHPRFFKYLDWAKATLDTPYGIIKSDWKKENNKVIWNITIPANAFGKIIIPEDAKNILFDKQPLDKNSLELASGNYLIVFDL